MYENRSNWAWSQVTSCNKRREFWRETRTPLWLLIGRIIFLTREKTSFAILIGRIIFFTCENHRSLLWLATTNLRTKIYYIAFWWVFLSMYIINSVVFVADARRKILFSAPHLKNVRNIIGSHEQNKEMNELRKLIMMNALKETWTHWIKKKKPVLVFVRWTRHRDIEELKVWDFCRLLGTFKLHLLNASFGKQFVFEQSCWLQIFENWNSQNNSDKDFALKNSTYSISFLIS